MRRPFRLRKAYGATGRLGAATPPWGLPPFTFHLSLFTDHLSPFFLGVRFLPSLPGWRDWLPNGIPLPGPNEVHLRASERSSFSNDHRGKNRSITRFLADSFGRRSPSNPV